VGDAFLTVSPTHWLDFRFLRAKIDVSRSQMASSASLIFVNRTALADYAADFVNESRRSLNAQVNAHWRQKIHAHWAFGEGVTLDALRDPRKKGPKTLESGGLMFGGKLRVSPQEGWEETQRSETSFGETQHWSIGLGYFETRGIRYRAGPALNVEDAPAHRLVNAEASVHWRGLNLQVEGFVFDGALLDFESRRTGLALGGYAQIEYVLPRLGFIAPFVRVEYWNRDFEVDTAETLSELLGINWYLRGDQVKLGLSLEHQTAEASLPAPEEWRGHLSLALHAW
jgi:hypothetical protein